nr:MAG TPA: hypothetical protein [Caudoviricetes sp.]
MSNTADALLGRTCYTYIMKDCNREPCGSHRPAGLFLCPKGGEPSAKKTETAVCLPRMSETY